VHWARLEASALGSLIAACPAWKKEEEEERLAVTTEVKRIDTSAKVEVMRSLRIGYHSFILSGCRIIAKVIGGFH